MPDVLVRDLSPDTIRLLKARASRHGRSMQSELKFILEQAASSESLDAAVLSAKIRRMLQGKTHSDSAELAEGGRGRGKRA